MPSGLEFPHIIDMVVEDTDSGTIVLFMHEHRPWSGSDEQIFQLQEKMNAYMAFALDGEMNEEYPQFAGRKIRVELNCVSPPDDRTLHYLKLIHDQIALQEIDFVVNVRKSS